MDYWSQIDFLIVFLGFLVVYALLHVYPFVFIKAPNFNETWQIFAKEMGFELKSGSKIYPGMRKQSEMSGYRNGREVKISSDNLGVIGNRNALFNFTISVENPSTQKLPAGAFLAIRKDPRVISFWYRFRRSFLYKNEEPTTLRDQYIIQSIPKNLGNFVFRQQATEILLQQSGVFDLHIDRNNLSYSLLGFKNQDGLMRQILESLYELAENFERFARNWF